jgi:filamentous hemagglutinin family protein
LNIFRWELLLFVIQHSAQGIRMIKVARSNQRVGGDARVSRHANQWLPHRPAVRPIATAVAIALIAGAPPLWAGPAGEQITAGQAAVSRAGTNTLISQSSDRVSINWQSFNIGATESVRFAQPSASSVALNRVLGQNPTEILGSLSANGQIFILNPNGVLFGKGAQVDVGGLVASTLSLSNDDLMAGRYRFSAPKLANGESLGSVTNLGNILANGGYVALIGPQVKNQGTISAANGGVVLAAGEQVTLNLNGNKLIGLTVDSGALNALADNKGLIKADGGQVVLTAKAADALIKSVVNNDGVIEAATLTETAGVIRLVADDVTNAGTLRANGNARGSITLQANNLLNNTGVVQANGGSGAGGTLNLQGDVVVHTGTASADGTTGGDVNFAGRNILLAGNASASATLGAAGSINVDATGRVLQTSQSQLSADSANGPGGQVGIRTQQSVLTSGTLSATGEGTGSGGKVSVLGTDINLLAATIDASGQQGGGNVLIGGDFQGKNPAVRNAKTTTANQATTIRADAKTKGDGGRVIVWSDQKTRFDGVISARGGSVSGNGGFVEVSGKENLSFAGVVDASASNGKPGTLLLDPKNIVIDDSGASINYVSLADPTPGTSEAFGGSASGGSGVVVLPNNNILVPSPGDGFVASFAGAVYLYNGTTGALMSTLTGAKASDYVGRVIVLPNGNYLVQSPNWANFTGAVTWGSGISGVSGVVSSANSLVGGQSYDAIGREAVTVLPNSNYIVTSLNWANGGAARAGAVTWGNGAAGVSGVVSSINSLVGSHTDDLVGNGGITILPNGNYLVSSRSWINGNAANVGAVTWGSGVSGVSGFVSANNSLVGSQSGDFVGGLNGVTVLPNGNYVVNSPFWANGSAANAGAVTWGNGVGGVAGVVSVSNSLVGTQSQDRVGGLVGVTVLTNGNYVVNSPAWQNNTGAVTWGNGSTGVTGVVSSMNSLVGSQSGDAVGQAHVGVTPLPNGNYVVMSPKWNNNRGAVTWGNGFTGSSGVVSSSNSLVGSQSFDSVGGAFFGELTILSNSNYLVSSPEWSNGAGAITWGSGVTGVTGVVSSSNSLVGSQSGDSVGGFVGRIVALPNGNYLVGSPNWSNGTEFRAGAVTWGNGTTGTTGEISSANSLVGSQNGDFVGRDGLTILPNSNYVVNSTTWSNGAIKQVGAITWGDGTTGVKGVVSATNSLVGSQNGDSVGSFGIQVLPNGNYIVTSEKWSNGTASQAGAVTWGNGATGVRGAVSAANSLVGTQYGDSVGGSFGGITVLRNGNYLVGSPLWANGTAAQAGALTWANSATGIVGAVSPSNSLVGTQSAERVGCLGCIVKLSNNDNFVVMTPNWGNVAGAVTWVNGSTGVTGTISAANSLVGTKSYDVLGINGEVRPLLNGNYVVVSPTWSGDRGAVTWGNGSTGVTGLVSAANSLVGSESGDKVGGLHNLIGLINGNYVVHSPQWANNRGAVTWGNGATGITGVVSSSNSLVGSQSGDFIGGRSGEVVSLFNGNYVVHSPSWANNTGAVTWGNGVAGVTGVVSPANSLIGTTNFVTFGTQTFVDAAKLVALSNGGYLVVRPYADNGSISQAGLVYLALPAAAGQSFGAGPSATSAISSASITSIANTGTAVMLQANNDITVNSAIVTNKPFGNGGALTLQAGRSIVLNKGITTDNGNLTLIANDVLANGVVDAHRDAGNAVITMAPGATLNAGTGDVNVELRDGAGKTNSSSGSIEINSIISASNIRISNNGSAGGALVINSGAVLNASGSGDALVLANSKGNFINNAGAGALNVTAGRISVQLANPGAWRGGCANERALCRPQREVAHVLCD